MVYATNKTDIDDAIYALRLRLKILNLIRKVKSGHTAGSLSCIDFIYILYKYILQIAPTRIHDNNRDRYIQSKGHAVEALYIILSEMGYFDPQLLETYLKFGSNFIGHVSKKIPGIEQSTGSLGHGLSLGAGMALAGQLNSQYYRVFVLLGDGEMAEGSVWEAVIFAAHYKLSNLIAVIDRNRLQITDTTDVLMKAEPLADKFTSFGWHVMEMDGHDITQLKKSLGSLSSHKEKPTAILMNTIKGCGISYMENDICWHHKVPTDEEYNIAVNEIQTKIRLMEE
ncbi:transketolase [Bartonella vinsonii]|uniref:Transketolase 2 n=1 Tax=Bartonella vinsonii TaxID=33047 RepID=A0A448V4Z7_BARVI|nr:transketolase [Bartonella vinsonii]VEJ44861.1 Transketolase 2 [Bartonella vinsonii]